MIQMFDECKRRRPIVFNKRVRENCMRKTLQKVRISRGCSLFDFKDSSRFRAVGVGIHWLYFFFKRGLSV